ncbi:MAG TPA: SDR family NAD(P)-dependent oxidoreductase, partial [Actinomycetota bacterium]|nr:SDR family NAD(P)-dependent oxidoreductase [Actinomycetota bacterium]
PDGAVRDLVLSLVAEKTGYPMDMLDLDLDLEADLGVDTVKQAEVFATIREAYGIPRDESVKLRDFPTLAHVIAFVEERAEGVGGGKPQPTPGAPEREEAGEVAEIPRATMAATAEVSAPAGPESAAEDAEVRAPGYAMETDVRERVLALVAEKTGYPPDMLDLDLDLEADLGIDTVKQAEVFATIREAYGIPRDETLKLRDFPTLAHVISFAQERASPAPVEPPDQVWERTDSTDFPRRVPEPVLRPALELCKPTGAALASGARVVIMPDEGGAGKELAQALEELGVSVLELDPTLDDEAVAGRVRSWLPDGPVQGMYWLPALDEEGAIKDMDLAGWREGLRRRVKLLAATSRVLYGSFDRPGTFLLAATRLGGLHGYDDDGAVAPMGGAVTGFVKAFGRERVESLVKAVDFESGVEPSAIARLLVEETQRDPGAVEIGYRNGLRWTIGLPERPAGDGEPGLPLTQDTVFVVTGAAGSIVSAIVADLAAASGGTFHLLDLAPEPDPEDDDLRRFATDREGLKRDLFERIKGRGERATPALVERELGRLERAHAALAAIEAIRAAGGEAIYHQLDLTDPAAVDQAIQQVRGRHGRIDVLLHAAGIEISHLLPDKEPREFELVFNVKADGWFNLLHAIDGLPVGAAVAFSSVAGRFGNAGQTDY